MVMQYQFIQEIADNKKISSALYNAKRVDFIAVADYSKSSVLYKRVCLLIDMISARIKYQNEVR